MLTRPGSPGQSCRTPTSGTGQGAGLADGRTDALEDGLADGLAEGRDDGRADAPGVRPGPTGRVVAVGSVDGVLVASVVGTDGEPVSSGSATSPDGLADGDADVVGVALGRRVGVWLGRRVGVWLGRRVLEPLLVSPTYARGGKRTLSIPSVATVM